MKKIIYFNMMMVAGLVLCSSASFTEATFVPPNPSKASTVVATYLPPEPSAPQIDLA